MVRVIQQRTARLRTESSSCRYLLIVIIVRHKDTDTLYRIGITAAAHTFDLHGEHSGGPITIMPGQGLCVEYRAARFQGAAIFADRAGVDTRRWAWYFGKVRHVRLEPAPHASDSAQGHSAGGIA